MTIVHLSEASEFLERAGPLLRADEARHNLILGIAGTIRDTPHVYAERHFWLVEDAGGVVGAALRTPPHNLVLARGGDEAIAQLARELPDLPGVVGAVPEVDRFAAAWTAAHGGTAERRFEQGIYAADAIVAPRPAPGRPRAATTEDFPLLAAWWEAFLVEALHEGHPDAADVEAAVRHRLEGLSNGIALWEDEGEVVSLVAYGSPTPTGIRIGPVYTPSEHRGRGYASALTGHVSELQLAAGRAFCFLYTDLANPTSNKIYVDLGYRRVCDAIQYAFV